VATPGPQAGRPHRQPDRARGLARGDAYVHTAIDDHSRLAYSEALANETAVTAAGFWHRADAFYRAAGITVKVAATRSRKDATRS